MALGSDHARASDYVFGLVQCIPFQVALSVGHLASLYNYDMEQYDKVSLDLLSFFFFALYTNGRSVSCQ